MFSVRSIGGDGPSERPVHGTRLRLETAGSNSRSVPTWRPGVLGACGVFLDAKLDETEEFWDETESFRTKTVLFLRWIQVWRMSTPSNFLQEAHLFFELLGRGIQGNILPNLGRQAMIVPSKTRGSLMVSLTSQVVVLIQMFD